MHFPIVCFLISPKDKMIFNYQFILRRKTQSWWVYDRFFEYIFKPPKSLGVYYITVSFFCKYLTADVSQWEKSESGEFQGRAQILEAYLVTCKSNYIK